MQVCGLLASQWKTEYKVVSGGKPGHPLRIRVPAILVRLVLHPLLHTEQMLTDRRRDQGTLLEPSTDINRRNVIRCCDDKIPRLPPIEQLERRLAQGRVPIRVIPKFTVPTTSTIVAGEHQ